MRALILIIALGLATSVQAAETKVYKQVNEDGSITYTDQPPEAGAETVTMPELQVVQPPVITRSLRDSRNRPASEVNARPYADLRMVKPEPEESFWGTGGTLTVQLYSEEPLDENHSINYYFDGELAGSSQSMTQILTEVFRGTHAVKADIVDQRGRVLASAGPVTFHMKQHSVQHPNRR